MQQSLTAFSSPDELHKRYHDYLAASPPPPVVGTAHPDAQPHYGPWSDWVYAYDRQQDLVVDDKMARFDVIADLAWKKAWYFADQAKSEELPLEKRLEAKATASALREFASAAKTRERDATLKGLRRWAHLIDNQARWEMGYKHPWPRPANGSC